MVTKAVAADPTPVPIAADPPAPIIVPPLPAWNDAASITSYITTILASVFAVITYTTGHGEPAVVEAVVPSVGAIIAGVAQLVNVITHRSVQKAAISAAQ